jgi:hypothetical protein
MVAQAKIISVSGMAMNRPTVPDDSPEAAAMAPTASQIAKGTAKAAPLHANAITSAQ